MNSIVAHPLSLTRVTGIAPTVALLFDKELLDIVAGGASESRIPQIGVRKSSADPELADELVVFGSKWIRFQVKANNTVCSAMKTLQGGVSEEVNVADVVGARHGGLGIFKDNVVVLVLELVVAVAVEVGDDGHATLFLRGAEGLVLAPVGYDFIVGGSGDDIVAFVLGAAASAAAGSIRGTEGEEKEGS